VNDYGPEFMATVILSSLLVILWHHRSALVSTFWESQATYAPESRTTHLIIRVSIVLAVLSLTTVGVLLTKMHGR
jgi:ABC-type Mn2+/Zn2+ transport system permease subunit